MTMVKNQLKMFLIASILMPFANLSFAGEGDCAGKKFNVNREGNIDFAQNLIVLRQGSLVYEDGNSTRTVTDKHKNGPMKLNFNERYKAHRANQQRIQIKETSSNTPFGWVERKDLLCSYNPIISKTGLEMKLYTQTATALLGNVKPVKAYTASNQNACPKGGCRKLARFHPYFVIDREDNRYLLGDTADFKDSGDLVGWVNADDGQIWETAYAVRPKPHISKICGYEKLTDAKRNINCNIPIDGGADWFRRSTRIPILEKVSVKDGEEYYRIMTTMLAAGRKLGGAGASQSTLVNENAGLEKLKNMKNVDVFFLIDGTQSVAPYIGAVKNVVKSIVTTLKGSNDFRETKFRFGYRIYRDAYAGSKELSEGLSLGNTRCNVETEGGLEAAQHKFNESISQVTGTTDSADDYEENLFGGIQKAVQDLKGCPDNTKLLFVVGDHGYSAEAQRKRGRTPINVNSLVDKLRGSQKDGIKSIVTFFVQTPADQSKLQQESYKRAYERYKNQARSILAGIMGPQSEKELRNYFLNTSDNQLEPKVLAGVKGFARSDLVNELVLDLEGGVSLYDAVNRLRSSGNYDGEVHGFYWDNMINGNCASLGNQCKDKVYEKIFVGYVKADDKVEEDVWVRANELDDWLKTLDKLSTSGNLAGFQQRQMLVNNLIKNLRNILKEFYPHDMSFFQYIEKARVNLPVNDGSPLLKYSARQLQDDSEVPDCEIRQLANWANISRRSLSIVRTGTKTPKYEYKKIKSKNDCRGNNPEFTNIADVASVRLGESDDYSYSKSYRGSRIFWVPKQYLP